MTGNVATPYYYLCPHCIEPAFLLTERPSKGTPALSKTIRHLDGSPLIPNSPIECDDCGLRIFPLDTDRVRTL